MFSRLESCTSPQRTIQHLYAYFDAAILTVGNWTANVNYHILSNLSTFILFHSLHEYYYSVISRASGCVQA